jgi:hypothetical protein
LAYFLKKVNPEEGDAGAMLGRGKAQGKAETLAH